MLKILRWIDRLVPNLERTFAKRHPVAQSDTALAERHFQRFLLSLVGTASIALIPLVIISDYLVGVGCLRDSLSHYAFSPFSGGLFVAAMAAVGILLFAYKGETVRDTRIATAAGLAALIIGIFSTTDIGFDPGEGCDVALKTKVDLVTPWDDPDTTDAVQVALTDAAIDAFDGVEVLHYGGVIVLFGAMIFFCLFTFRLASAEDKLPNGQLKPIKVKRNTVYLICALVLIGCGVWLATSFRLTEQELRDWNTTNTTLLIEVISFVALGLAWLIKGRFFNRPWLMS